MRRALRGQPASRGIALGRVRVRHPQALVVSEQRIRAEDVPDEILRLHRALDAVLARRVELEEELIESLAREAQAAERLRSRVAFMQRRIAKVLHSVVQGELVTSAVGLSHTDDPDVVAAEIDRVSVSIVERLHADESAVESRERILDLLSLWSAALAVGVMRLRMPCCFSALIWPLSTRFCVSLAV